MVQHRWDEHVIILWWHETIALPFHRTKFSSHLQNNAKYICLCGRHISDNLAEGGKSNEYAQSAGTGLRAGDLIPWQTFYVSFYCSLAIPSSTAQPNVPPTVPPIVPCKCSGQMFCPNALAMSCPTMAWQYGLTGIQSGLGKIISIPEKDMPLFDPVTSRPFYLCRSSG